MGGAYMQNVSTWQSCAAAQRRVKSQQGLLKRRERLCRPSGVGSDTGGHTLSRSLLCGPPKDVVCSRDIAVAAQTVQMVRLVGQNYEFKLILAHGITPVWKSMTYAGCAGTAHVSPGSPCSPSGVSRCRQLSRSDRSQPWPPSASAGAGERPVCIPRVSCVRNVKTRASCCGAKLRVCGWTATCREHAVAK